MRLLKRAAMIIVCLLSLFAIYIQLTFKRKFDVPVTGIKASTDSAIVARGKYIVNGQAHCYHCHMPDSMKKLGPREPLIGGYAFKTPFGDIYTPNITSDNATGVGAWTDEELAQALRYNVDHNKNALVGIMPFNSMSDEDLTAVVSYMRTMKPVRNAVPEHDINILGKALMRFVIGPVEAEVSHLKPDSSAAYGKYLAYTVANCNGCHTRRGAAGGYEGDPFGGGNEWKTENGTFISPNITPNDTVGRIAKWNYEVFERRFRAGKLMEETPMPWENFQEMSESDLKAIYNFLQSLEPSNHVVQTTFKPAPSTEPAHQASGR
ncbi:c-type cytochrome [Chryseolinea sp. T2]|uniref:c-type cytochrome n=1 Tax=Chryseolinea sp. T2 TaxID=3129255 RepID=UPI0030780F31